MNTYKLSSGDRINKSTIDFRVRKAKKKKLDIQQQEHGYNFCEDCKISSGRLDCSHDVSVDECQKSGKSELAYDVENITIRCRECHLKQDKNGVAFLYR
jgi:hypothetical protein